MLKLLIFIGFAAAAPLYDGPRHSTSYPVAPPTDPPVAAAPVYDGPLHSTSYPALHHVIHLMKRTSPLPMESPAFEDHHAPHIIQEVEGRDVELNCKATGYPMPEISWWKDGVNLLNDKYKFEDYNLKLTHAMTEDNGKYTCVVTNEVGNITRTFDLDLYPPGSRSKPQIWRGQPGNRTVHRGQDIKLRCEPKIEAYEKPLWIVWYFHKNFTQNQIDREVIELQSCEVNGSCVNDDNIKYMIEDASALLIQNVTEAETGMYSCEIKNQYGSSTRSGYVHLRKKIMNVPFIVKEEKIIDFDEEPTVYAAGMNFWLVGSVFAASILIVMIISLAFCLKQRRQRRQVMRAVEKADRVYHWTKVVITKMEGILDQDSNLEPPSVVIEKRSIMVDKDWLLDEAPETEYVFDSADDWEFDRDLLTHTDEVLGEGEFGHVVKATTTSKLPGQTLPPVGSTPVAIKMLKEGHSEEDMIDMVKEMEIMKAMGHHKNVINLLGVCKKPPGKPLLLVIEYAENGDLRSFLRAQRPTAASPPTSPYEVPLSNRGSISGSLDYSDMLRMGREIAEGMEFLAERRFVHRDLAARNIFLSKGLNCKIGDFGMAREISSTDYYRKLTAGKLPIKWMSPEAIADRKFTTKSDVWSFGVVLWEIATLGEPPHRVIDAETFMNEIQTGKTLQPAGPYLDHQSQFWSVMFHCWQFLPEDRPDWCLIRDQLSSLQRGYLLLSNSAPFLPGRTTTNSSTSSGISSSISAAGSPTKFKPQPPPRFTRLSSCHSPSSPSMTSPTYNQSFSFDQKDTAWYVNESMKFPPRQHQCIEMTPFLAPDSVAPTFTAPSAAATNKRSLHAQQTLKR